MKFVILSLLVFGGFVIFLGCGQQNLSVHPANTVKTDGLEVSLDVPKRNFKPGETFRVKLTARNTTKDPMRILATTGAPVYVRIWRHTGLGWEEVKRYPRAATMVMSPWTLEPHSVRSFVMQLTVEPDWPTAEALRITAELNGRREAAPGVTIEVFTTVQPRG